MNLLSILGFDSDKLWWYRDLALGSVASIAAMWTIVLLPAKTSFDLKVSVASALIAVACCLVSPNRFVILGIVLGVVAIQGWVAVLIATSIKAWFTALA